MACRIGLSCKWNPYLSRTGLVMIAIYKDIHAFESFWKIFMQGKKYGYPTLYCAASWGVAGRLGDRKGQDDDHVDDGDASSEYESLSNSNDDDDDECGFLLPQPGKKKKRVSKQTSHYLPFPTHSETESPFYLGQKFKDIVELREAITTYSVSIGRDIKYIKNDKTRIGAKCKARERGCPWYLWASMSGNGTLSVKTHIPQHNYGRVARVKKIRATWIASKYHGKFKINPYLKCQEIVDSIWSEWGIKISLWMALKARRMAHRLILGEYKEQYLLLHRYAQEILRSNPDNTVKFKLNNNGFLVGCRPFFGLGGCFLKGPYGGQLLVAVDRDGNNQMFPIAWACVEIENTETWTWFLCLLADDLGTADGAGYTIMSDQQKGLLKAVGDIWPSANTRVCARHVYCNFRLKFGGSLQYRRLFWKVAKSTTENEFTRNMQLFSLMSVKVGEDLMKRNYKKWVRAFLTSTSQCESIDNNMNEVFNAYILSSRHKSIITMLEDIRESLMERLHKKRDFIGNKDIQIRPRIKKKLKKSKIDARGWVAFWDGHFTYGVREGATQTRYVLSGVPCNHAVAAIWKAIEHPERYVSTWFTKEKYLKAYEFPLEPLNGPQERPESPYAPIQAPMIKKLQNRPTTKRKPSLGEVEGCKQSKKGELHKCTNCGEAGHNKRKCPLPLIDNPMPQSSKPAKSSQVGDSTESGQHQAPKKLKQTSATKGKRKGKGNIVPDSSSQVNLPIHNRGVGLYTYPKGYTRQAVYINQNQALSTPQSNLIDLTID
ncbi:uncharacterized protein LOC110706442 [Chenopodium quinoa]|uniref:uncharacterized protein LOC110706442 n=1 Tax=Chenopodium quinoa TaxID=63459 RepID=UPI000B798B2F|nr:uncharacterized protein LOC110706442 [Chenopodium quinoa]